MTIATDELSVTDSTDTGRSHRLPLAVLALLLVTNIPLFVCAPVSNDPALYDLQAKILLNGGVLYRDVLEPNLPGVVWIHVLIRSVLGWSFEALRIADIVFFSVFVWLACRWLIDEGKNVAAASWTAVVIFLFYLSVSEWCHCQRDMWMLPLSMGALHVRQRSISRIKANSETSRSVFRDGFIEGLLWGAAFWIKPHVAIPALLCWIVGAVQIRQFRNSVWNGAGVIAGGAVLGAAGIAWMVTSGCWGPFMETVREWNPRYVAVGKEHWTTLRFLAMSYRMFPWILVHLLAFPIAASAVWKGLKRPSVAEVNSDAVVTRLPALTAALYIGWLIQSFFVQHLFDYVHAPAILLAVLVLSEKWSFSPFAGFRRTAIAGFLAVAVIASPLLRSDRLLTWGLCFTEGSSPNVRNRLAQIDNPDWVELEKVAVFLERQQLKDGEVAAYSNDSVYLYDRLDVAPPTRFVYLESLTVFFPDQRRFMLNDLAGSPARYVVSNLTGAGMSPQEMRAPGRDGPASLPSAFPDALRNRFPWSLPVAYRSGSLIVHSLPRKSATR